MKKFLILVLFATAVTAGAQNAVMPNNTVLGTHANDVRTTALAAWNYRKANLNNLLTSEAVREQYRQHQLALARSRAQIVEDFSTITKLMNVMHNDLENAEILQGVE